MFKRIISVGLFALTAGTLWSLNRQLQQQRSGSREQGKRPAVPVHIWEGEGGALPATGAQLGPDPVVPASTAAVTPEEHVH